MAIAVAVAVAVDVDLVSATAEVAAAGVFEEEADARRCVMEGRSVVKVKKGNLVGQVYLYSVVLSLVLRRIRRAWEEWL
ncbi:hypothetical protein [Herbiconiux sp. A18JL235]|uniref:Secreted protein n=1 Tax=Herbiconiux sp. A18JL235 TaxID=3152363 RepID=A0AB39BCV6_9MICO